MDPSPRTGPREVPGKQEPTFLTSGVAGDQPGLDSTMTLGKRNSLQEDLLHYQGKPPSTIFPYVVQDEDESGYTFPKKLAFALSSLKVPCGVMLIILGYFSIVLDVSMASLGGAIWAGSASMVTGFFGIIASKRPDRGIYLIVLLCFSVLCVATAGVAVVFASTGLAHDLSVPNSYYVDDNGDRVPFVGEINTQSSVLGVGILTILVALIDCCLSIACSVICARKACHCYTCNTTDPTFADPDSKVRRDRLISWLGQQALMDAVLSGKLPHPSELSPPRSRWHTPPINEDNPQPVPLVPNVPISSGSSNSADTGP